MRMSPSSYNRLIEVAVKWLTPERIKLYPTTICILTFVAWGVSLAIGRGLTDVAGTIIGPDFLQFYAAGKFFLTGRMTELYNISAFTEFQKNVLAPVSHNALYVFVYPPFTVAFCVPFALGGYLTGLFLWWTVGLSALALSLYLLKRELPTLSRYSTGRLFIISFFFFPTIIWFLFGQNTTFTLLLYTLTFVMLRRQHDFSAGLSLGLLFYKPQLALALSIVLLLKWRWRALIGGIAGAGVWIITGLVVTPQAMKRYVELVPCLLQLQRRHDLMPTWGQNSFYGFSALLFDSFWKRGADILGLLLTVGGIVVIATLWHRTDWKPGTRTWDIRLTATIALGLLISPHLYLYDLMLLLLPIAIVWSYYPSGTQGRALDGGPLLVWTALLYAVCFFGSYLSLAEMHLTRLIGLPGMAFQLSVPILIVWVIVIISLSTESSLADKG